MSCLAGTDRPKVTDEIRVAAEGFGYESEDLGVVVISEELSDKWSCQEARRKVKVKSR